MFNYVRTLVSLNLYSLKLNKVTLTSGEIDTFLNTETGNVEQSRWLSTMKYDS